MVEPFVAFVAEIRSVEESIIGVASIVVFALLDETDDPVGGYGSSVDDHMRWVDGHDFDLVPRQGGLRLSEFEDTARPFGNSGKPVKFFGFSFLDRIALFEILVVSVLGIPVRVYQSLHRDDGTSTTQVVLVLDNDSRLFHDTSNGGTARFVSFAVSTARTWGTNESGLHGEGVIGGEFFVGVEFGRKGLEICVQSFTAFLELGHGEGGGLEGVGKGTGLHGEKFGGMRCQGIVGGNMLLDRPLKGVGEFLP